MRKLLPKYLLLACLTVLTLVAGAQTSAPAGDESFNIFLLVLATIFFSGVLGAALTGAALVMLLFLFVAVVFFLGLVSASVGVAVYRRSLASGFRMFLSLLVGFSFAITGGACGLLVNILFPNPLSAFWMVGFGLTGGLIAGISLARLTTGLILRLLIRVRRTLIPA
jgi:hypothetical protein